MSTRSSALNCGSSVYVIACSHAPGHTRGSRTASLLPAPTVPMRHATANVRRNNTACPTGDKRAPCRGGRARRGPAPGLGARARQVAMGLVLVALTVAGEAAQHPHDGELVAARAADL